MTAEEWLAIGRERAADAEAILQERPSSVCSVYLVGYGIECALKAYLQATGRRVITSGAAGHNLVDLWKSAGLKKSDVGGTSGSRTFFFDEWSVALRYETDYDFGGRNHVELVDGAKLITGWLHQQVKHKKLRRRR